MPSGLDWADAQTDLNLAWVHMPILDMTYREEFNQARQIPRLIGVFTGAYATVSFLVWWLGYFIHVILETPGNEP